MPGSLSSNFEFACLFEMRSGDGGGIIIVLAIASSNSGAA
jgi:hypothetical protein